MGGKPPSRTASLFGIGSRDFLSLGSGVAIRGGGSYLEFEVVISSSSEAKSDVVLVPSSEAAQPLVLLRVLNVLRHGENTSRNAYNRNAF